MKAPCRVKPQATEDSMATFTIPELYKALFSYVGPPFPLAGQGLGQQLSGRIPLQGLAKSLRQDAVQEIAPLSLQIEEQEPWQLPVEPILDAKGGNRIIRRYAQQSTQRGSYKERWEADDISLTVRGVLINTEEEQPPVAQIQRLKTFFEQVQVTLHSPLLEPLKVSLVTIHNWQLPHTPGLQNQAYTFSCYADSLDYNLLQDA